MAAVNDKGAQRMFFYVCMVCANLLSIVAGMSLSWTSPVLPKLDKANSDNPLHDKISTSAASWIGGLLSLGATIGPFLGSFASEKLGRKMALFLIDLPFLAGFLILAFAETLWLYYLARVLIGLSIGGTFAVLPNYVMELCPDHLRGTQGGLMGTSIVSGIFLSYAIGPFVTILCFNLICAALATSVAVIFLLFMPETPQFLISHKKQDEAKVILTRLRDGAIDDEFIAICDIVRENSGGSFRDLTSKGNMKALIVSCSMLAAQQLSGINIVQFYAQRIFDDSGSSIPSDISPIIVGGVQVAASIVTPFVADRTGRKFLFTLSLAGMLIAEVPLGVFFYLKDDQQDVDAISWLPIACLVVYITFYNWGIGPLPWTLMAEIFPPNVKSFASSICAATCWFISFLLTFFFADVSDEIGIGGSFWLFSGCNAFFILVVVFYVPETRGKSQKEIQQMLAG